MTHKYMPKIFHDTHKNPLPLPSPTYYILNVRSLIKNDHRYVLTISRDLVSSYFSWICNTNIILYLHAVL